MGGNAGGWGQTSKFASSNPNKMVHFHALCHGVYGTIGINGTVSGGEEDMKKFLAWLREQKDDFADMDVKYSRADNPPFYRMRVRLKKEIVTMGRPDIRPTPHCQGQGGSYVLPSDWDALINHPDVLLVRVPLLLITPLSLGRSLHCLMV